MEKEIINADASTKSRLAALLLAVFLGGFGLHRMYVGRVKSGLVQLILTITIIGAFITGIWVFIDILFIIFGKFEDSENKILKNW